MLKGKKTYLAAVAVGILTAVKMMGWIDQQVYDAVLAFLGAAGLASMRSAVKR